MLFKKNTSLGRTKSNLLIFLFFIIPFFVHSEQNLEGNYTNIKILDKISSKNILVKLKNGESIFKFDQISDKFTLKIGFDQQLFGPIILKSNGTLNLDNDSNDYGEFIDSKISLNWKKRSYEFGIFYQPHNQAGGIAFSLYGFK